MMNFVVLTIFPEMFDSFWSHGIIRRAIEQQKIFTSTVNIRDYAGTGTRLRTTDRMAAAAVW
jgi:tRNA (guanine37-N1)-methyltransferase